MKGAVICVSAHRLAVNGLNEDENADLSVAWMSKVWSWLFDA
jgi:hypothetical protein